jgi:hypothetical protein
VNDDLEQETAFGGIVEGRLRHGDGSTPVLGMFDIDEELARPGSEGAIAHAVIASLAAVHRKPTLFQIKAEVDRALGRFAPIEARAHRQNVTGVVHRYFSRCLPPARYFFGGTEFDLGVGRADLVWFDVDGLVLADEIKTGSPRSLRLTTTLEQVERYRAACLAAWGERFVGLRLLCPCEPAASIFIRPDGGSMQLSVTLHQDWS